MSKAELVEMLLRRHFQRLIQLPGEFNQEIGKAFKDLIDEGFEHYRLWEENQERAVYDEWGIGFKNKVELTLKQWCHKAGYEAGKLLRTLKSEIKQWWYFLLHPEIPPDNNLAERSLSLAITNRKVSSVQKYGKISTHSQFIDCGTNLSSLGAFCH